MWFVPPILTRDQANQFPRPLDEIRASLSLRIALSCEAKCAPEIAAFEQAIWGVSVSSACAPVTCTRYMRRLAVHTVCAGCCGGDEKGEVTCGHCRQIGAWHNDAACRLTISSLDTHFGEYTESVIKHRTSMTVW